MQNRAEKQIKPWKITINRLFNDIWCYFFIASFDWKIGVFQQTVVRVYYILNIRYLKGTVRQIENALINDHLRVSKESWKFCIPTIYNFAAIYPSNLLFSYKVAYFLTISIFFSVYKQSFMA